MRIGVTMALCLNSLNYDFNDRLTGYDFHDSHLINKIIIQTPLQQPKNKLDDTYPKQRQADIPYGLFL
jgi:hypothetical protein